MITTEPQVTTRIRRTHLGIRYDLFVDGAYSATAYTAKEIEPLVEWVFSRRNKQPLTTAPKQQ